MNEQIAEKLGDLLVHLGKSLSCAESCTGGGIAWCLTSVPGSSKWFDRSYVTYSNESKRTVLGVDEALITTYGAVSEEVVAAMQRGLIQQGNTDFGIAVSGIAGPEGGTQLKPVGTVCIAWGDKHEVATLTYLFKGKRNQIRELAITQSMLNMYQFITRP